MVEKKAESQAPENKSAEPQPEALNPEILPRGDWNSSNDGEVEVLWLYWHTYKGREHKPGGKSKIDVRDARNLAAAGVVRAP